MTPSARPRTCPPRAAALRLGALTALALAAQLAGCRGLLGIDDLDPSTDGSSTDPDEEGPAGGGGAAGARAGAAGAAKAGAAGKAGAGAGAGGKAGSPGKAGAGGKAGASGTTPADPRKACQQRCADQASPGSVEAYYEAVGACACANGGPGHGCAKECGSCALSPASFPAASSACVACIAARAASGSCRDEAEDCDGDGCEDFAACVEACGVGGAPDDLG